MSGLSVIARRLTRGQHRPYFVQRLFYSPIGRAETSMMPMACTRSLTSNLFHTNVSRSTSVFPQVPRSSGTRSFISEAEFHPVADETLDVILDAMEEFFEEIGSDEMEVNCADGVLTLSLPPHGTWVINKQTPNRQLWWSSPISGPRRYEYENGQWVFTRSSEEAPSTLGDALAEEIRELFDVELELDI